MPDLARTTTYDPHSEKYYDVSPQSFLNNNPLSFVDPTGMDPDAWQQGGESNTLFKSTFLNQNGGHWSDEYRNQNSSNEESGENSSGGGGKGKEKPKQSPKEKEKGQRRNNKKEKYADWQKKGQKVIKAIDSWLFKSTYLEAGASLKTGTYVDVGLKHTARVTLGHYDENGYSWNNQEGLNKIRTKKFVLGGGYDVGAQYTYDVKKEEHSGSVGYGLFSIESNGDALFIGVNINLSGGIGIGGETGIKIGLKF